MKKKRIGEKTLEVCRFLLENEGCFTYSEIAVHLGGSSRGARGIGACMRAIGKLGFSWFCNRVKNK